MDLHHTAVKEETGFSAVEMLLSLIIVTLITFVGYYVYHTQQAANATYNAVTSSAQATAPKTKHKAPAVQPTAAPANQTITKNFLAIKEWGVKLEFADADKVTYVYDKANDGANLMILTSITSSSQCQGLGVSLTRSSKSTGGGGYAGEEGLKVRNYYYYLGGSPGSCGGSASVEQLRSNITGNELLPAFKNLSVL